ncbi:MAG: hypothetical protein IJQ08_00365 [Synergistaceae bacterium]|nr:hypothetical protein [Synergistaceae bacterium]
MSDTLKTVLVDGGSPVAVSDEDTRFIYNLLPVGEFYDKRYGHVSITNSKLQQMAENFGKYPSYEVPVKLGHDDGAKSPGKVIGIEAKPEGLEITMTVDQQTAQDINGKQYRYMSAEYDDDYYDKATGQRVGPVLLGAALVNQPAHPYVAPLVLADDINPKERNDDSMNELEDLRLQLSDMKAQKAQAEAELEAERQKNSKEAEESAKKIADLEAENKALTEEREKVEEARNEAETKALCDKWTANGIPPKVVDMVRPLLLAKTSRIFRLSDKPEDERPAMKFFDDMFEAMSKVPMGQISHSDKPEVELSEYDKAIKRGQAIAAIVNGKEE